jgi:two-component system alkaline phosphatase synthesis response regulator PhoP
MNGLGIEIKAAYACLPLPLSFWGARINNLVIRPPLVFLIAHLPLRRPIFHFIDEERIKILVADDEEDILDIIRYNLEQAGYIAETALNGEEAIRKAKYFKPRLIILDIMMPHKNGMETLKELRGDPDFARTLFLFLTALGNEASEVEGLNLGADDYIVKPIKPQVLLSRIKALLRRSSHAPEENILRAGDLVINRDEYSVTCRGEKITLPRKEFELLSLLASKPGRVFPRQEILNKVWGSDIIVGDRTIDVHVRKIRQKTGDIISTVKGVGYRFNP